MSVDLLELISDIPPLGDVETSAGCFRTLVPWVAPEAFLNIVFKPAPQELLSRLAEKWRFPLTVVDVLVQQNGAMLFSGSLNLYGVVESDTVLNRQDRFSLPPFNIDNENDSWTFDRDCLLVVGGY
ncbi:MAG: hypothetical protein M3O20_02885 [Acidobacteriota bacterium]|nr:hypothetical protein [Acidobacteriota bacterium]